MTPANSDLIAQYIVEHKDRFYRIAYSYTQNSENALDVIQDAVYKALASAHTLREPQYIKTWFHRILVNAAIDYLRKNKKYLLTEENYHLEEGKLDQYENLDLKNALLSLPADQRMIIILRFFEDLKINEIADILGENINTVKTRLYKALKKLKLDITAEEDTYDTP